MSQKYYFGIAYVPIQFLVLGIARGVIFDKVLKNLLLLLAAIFVCKYIIFNKLSENMVTKTFVIEYCQNI